MRLTGICVSVGYADLLAKSIERWHLGLDRLVIVTSNADTATQDLCRHHNIDFHATDVFYANGAKFNKGAGLSEACFVKRIREHADWLLTFDSDIVPPIDWRSQLEASRLQKGRLYGTYRYQQPENEANPMVDYRRQMRQGWVLGFFSLFHSSDPRLPRMDEPLFDICWPHAGNYDTAFTNRWGRHDQTILPIAMIHLGEERAHWTGRGKAGELHREFFAKRRGIEQWDHEKMTVPPILQKPIAFSP